jgi:hypothetical protein
MPGVNTEKGYLENWATILYGKPAASSYISPRAVEIGHRSASPPDFPAPGFSSNFSDLEVGNWKYLSTEPPCIEICIKYPRARDELEWQSLIQYIIYI